MLALFVATFFSDAAYGSSFGDVIGSLLLFMALLVIIRYIVVVTTTCCFLIKENNIWWDVNSVLESKTKKQREKHTLQQGKFVNKSGILVSFEK